MNVYWSTKDKDMYIICYVSLLNSVPESEIMNWFLTIRPRVSLKRMHRFALEGWNPTKKERIKNETIYLIQTKWLTIDGTSENVHNLCKFKYFTYLFTVDQQVLFFCKYTIHESNVHQTFEQVLFVLSFIFFQIF